MRKFSKYEWIRLIFYIVIAFLGDVIMLIADDYGVLFYFGANIAGCGLFCITLFVALNT